MIYTRSLNPFLFVGDCFIAPSESVAYSLSVGFYLADSDRSVAAECAVDGHVLTALMSVISGSDKHDERCLEKAVQLVAELAKTGIPTDQHRPLIERTGNDQT